jgi:predicted N-acetyltransferase YhbS
MAAVTRIDNVAVRAAAPGEGQAIAALWRELWDAHDAWGGYPAARDPRVYAQLAARLEEDARVRAGQAVLGRHVHLVATYKGMVTGQVEGWFERHGTDATTPYTCEVRSLIVTASMRRSGTGQALLEALAHTVEPLSHELGVVLAAEVLEPNPAQTFYARVGYHPIAWSARIASEARLVPRPSDGTFSARVADAGDALAVAMLETALAARRRAAGDVRFDRPRAVEATLVGAIAAHLGRAEPGPNDAVELVAVDPQGHVRGSASFAIGSLDPPFVPSKRAVVGRFAVDPALDPKPLMAPLIALGQRIAAQRGAPRVELTDLTAPGSAIYEAAIACGGRPWSRIVTKFVPGR